jgi:hypothetical protein
MKIREDFTAKIKKFRRDIENTYDKAPTGCGSSLGEILCYEIHSQPVNPRLPGDYGLTFKELAAKWGITVSFLGEVIADHCRKLEEK